LNSEGIFAKTLFQQDYAEARRQVDPNKEHNPFDLKPFDFEFLGEKLTFGFDEYPITDRELSNMITALLSHPKLVELNIYGSHAHETGAHFGELCKRAFQPIANNPSAKVRFKLFYDEHPIW
jgi:hypothetical protein